MKKRKLFLLCLVGLFLLSSCKPDQPKKIERNETPKTTLEEWNTSETTNTSQIDSEIESVQETATTNDLIFDTHNYDYDVVTGATQTTFGSNPQPLYTYEEKLKKMYWSNQPPLGLMEGNYFINEGLVDVGNKGIVEIITDNNGKIVNVEYQEYAAENYYSSEFAGANKRLSHYAFFQAENPRTDTTLATIVNGVTFVEKQMREENRITGNFETVKGSSTSAREGLMAIASQLSDEIRQPSETKYKGYAENIGNGLTGRLQLTMKDGKIVTARYDEYFADQPDQIQDSQLQQYYRQSKYFSLQYNAATKNEFKNFSDQLEQAILEKQTLQIENEELKKHSSFEAYSNLASKIKIQ